MIRTTLKIIMMILVQVEKTKYLLDYHSLDTSICVFLPCRQMIIDNEFIFSHKYSVLPLTSKSFNLVRMVKS
jgi:hypothetical protein